MVRFTSKIGIFLCLLFLSQGVFAITFSKVCGEGQYLVRSHYRSGYVKTDGTLVSSAQVSAHCKNYRTAKPPEPHFRKMKSRSFRSWSKKEKRMIQEALKKLPKILTHIGKITFYRKKMSKYPNNPASVNTKIKRITIYDSIYQYNLERVISHELAHILYHRLSDQERDSYTTIANWKLKTDKTGEEIMQSTRTVFTEDDGKSSPKEDFSNNIEYYLFDKKTLRRKNPKIYQWIDKYMEEKEK